MVKRRSAFSMIELIFAIVIIGIAVAGVPRIIARNSQSLDDNLIQEGVFAVSAKAAQLLTYRWDANSQDPNDLLSHSKILDMPGGSTDLNRTNSIFRQGGVVAEYHRRFHSAVANPAGIVFDGVSTGIDNFILGGSQNADAYKHNFRVNIGVSYVADGDGTYNTGATGVTHNLGTAAATAGTDTNMKMGTVTLQMEDENGNWNNMVELRVYAANIGEVDYFKRTMP